MKKNIRFMIALLMVVMALAACGSNGGTKSEKEKTEMQDDKMSDDKNSEMKEDKMMQDDKMSDDKNSEMKDDSMMKDEKKNDGEMAMDFTLMNKDGKEFSLSTAKGEKVYVKFWASWCSICLAGLEELNTLAGKDNDFKIVTIVSPNAKGEKSKEDFIEWFDTLGYNNVEVLFDEGGTVADTYGVRAFPTSVLVGSDGVLTAVRPGHMSTEMIEKAFAEIQ
ncbi:MAG: redoxin family protein [Eubacteriales bacterium]|nr:redoxin family protein [Eubacteriales bacterium]